MYDKFNYSTDDIYILISERDRKQEKVGSLVRSDNSPIHIFGKYRGYWHIRNKGGTFHTGGNFPWGGIIHIPANSTWITEGSKNVITASTPHGEIKIKLSFIP
jgi:hypothetical protein